MSVLGITRGSGIGPGDRVVHYPYGCPEDPSVYRDPKHPHAPERTLYLNPLFFAMVALPGLTPREEYTVLDVRLTGFCDEVLITVENDNGARKEYSGWHFRPPAATGKQADAA